jgi:diketogulonate reductase-like aldo/keto reductase
MPQLGLGTWEVEGDEAREITEVALEAGYRHLDTAQLYGNEEEVGRGLEASGLDPQEVFVTTKVWPDNFPGERFRRSVEESLEKLGLEQVDLLLLHWPRFRGATLEETVQELARVHSDGLARHVGVSNFNIELLDRALAAAQAPLVTNQVEYHPFLDQSKLLSAVEEREMILTAYSPLAHGRVPGNDTLRQIGEKHGKSAVQVALRWLVQQGTVVIPRTSDPEHCRLNMEIFDFELGTGEMERIHDMARPDGRVLSPRGLAPEWD